MDVIETFAKHVLNTTYQDLSPEVVEAAKTLVMDSVAVSLGGSRKEGIPELLRLLNEWGGKQEGTVWVFGSKLPCVSAAQMNSVMGHALDYDDMHDIACFHAGPVTIAPAVVMAEKIGAVDGKKLITSIALGVDFACRLILAREVSMFESGWHPTVLDGNFCAATVAAKLLELDEEKLINAYGLAYHQACGNYQALHDGSLGKRMGPGFAARNGVMAALMAEKGITGAKNVLQGAYGFFNTYHAGKYKPERLTVDLGKVNEIANLSFKPYPCCRASHTPIDATLAVVQRNDIHPEDVESVSVSLGKGIYDIVCRPLKQQPRTIVDAQFSIPWIVATAIAHRKVELNSFTPEAIQNSAVLALASKVTPRIDETLITTGVSPAIVEVKTKKGKTFSHRVDIPYGSPENRMSKEVMANKLRACAAFAAKPLPLDKVEQLINVIWNLEQVRDMREAVHLLA